MSSLASRSTSPRKLAIFNCKCQFTLSKLQRVSTLPTRVLKSRRTGDPKLSPEGHDMASLNMRPLGDRVVVKPLDREEVTKSGIVLPDTAKEKPQQGEVLAVAPGRILDSGERVVPDVKQGERVLFAKYSGTEFKLEQDELLILRESDILAIVTNNGN